MTFFLLLLLFLFYLRYEVRFQNKHECGGAYIKLLADTPSLSLENFGDKTEYSIMFGPDKCGGDSKVIIFPWNFLILGVSTLCIERYLLLTISVNSLSANPTKRSNTLKQFVGNSRQIVWVCLTILCGWRLKVSLSKTHSLTKINKYDKNFS